MSSGILKRLARLNGRQPDPLLEEMALRRLFDDLTPSQRQQMAATEINIVLASSKGIYAGMAGAFLLAAVASWYSASAARTASYWVWFVLLMLGLGHSAWVCSRFRTTARRVEETLRTGRSERRIVAAYSAVWGASSWLMLPTSTPGFQAFLMACIGLVMMGMAGAFAVQRSFVLAAVIPIATVFASGLFRLGDTLSIVMAVAFCMLAYITVDYAKVQEHATRAAIALRFKTETLLAEIRAQQELTAKALAQAEASREAAELANHGKTTFLAAAGHDLRQPMHALVQYFAHLKRRNADPTLEETIARMGKSLDAMQDLLDSVLEVSKLMMGSVRPVIAPFQVADVLERLDAQLRPIAEDKGLSFVIEGGESVTVDSDEVLLERVLRNLVLNAIRYTQRGRVIVRCKHRSDKLSIQVWDTGIGIAKTEQGKVFEAFYQISNDARDRRKGLGLGLALVRQLSELLGLQLRLRSSRGRGSVFMIEVPTVNVPRAPSPMPASGHDFVRNAFVVLIDDNETSLEATSATLADFGCHVVAARSGLHAIELLQGQEFMPQLVISDYRLEHGETGIDAIRMVVANQQALFGDEFDIPALVISGDTAPDELQVVRDAGYVMLHKPLKPDALHVALNQALAAPALAVEPQG